MKVEDAKAECQRWLDYLDREKERSAAIQKIAGAVRRKEIDSAEGQKQLRAIDNNRRGVTVYDGAKLAEAVALLIRQ